MTDREIWKGLAGLIERFYGPYDLDGCANGSQLWNIKKAKNL